MKRIQKIAMMTFITLSVCTVLAAIAVSVSYYVGFKKPWAGCGIFGLAGIIGLAPFIFKEDDEPYDELDKEIQQKASRAGFAVSYMAGGLACMLPYFILGLNSTITIHWLPSIFGIMGYAFYMVYSISILTLYRRFNKEESYG